MNEIDFQAEDDHNKEKAFQMIDLVGKIIKIQENIPKFHISVKNNQGSINFKYKNDYFSIESNKSFVLKINNKQIGFTFSDPNYVLAKLNFLLKDKP